MLDAPYVDLPFTSWVNAGMDDQLDQERARGNAVLTKLLTAPDSTTWVAAPDLTTAAAAKLWESGIRHVVLASGSYQPVPPTAAEPTLARPFQIATPLATPLDAVSIDDRLEAAFNRDADPQLAAYQMLAELSIIEGEDPGAERGVVVAAPPGWKPSAPFLQTLFDGLAHDPLLRPVTIGNLFTSVSPVHSGEDGDGPAVVRQLKPARPVGLGAYPASLETLQDDIVSYQLMVGPNDAVVDGWNQRLLVSGSSDLTPASQAEYLTDIQDYIQHQVRGIDAPQHQTVTLTASEGNIPLTVRSRLRRSVKVKLSLQSNQRLDFPGADRDHHPPARHAADRVEGPRPQPGRHAPDRPGHVTRRSAAAGQHPHHRPVDGGVRHRLRPVDRRRPLPGGVVGPPLASRPSLRRGRHRASQKAT